MKLSHEKIVHLSHVLVRALEDAPGVRFAKDSNDVRLDIVKLLRNELRLDEEIEGRVRGKITAQKRMIPEGSEEYDILYRKYYEEEIGKLRDVRD
ncbi:MAG TPA: DUF507 family protein [Candidatus Saccharimonadales bacterium]|nr:DUF507 family protein [Candidatus Saccharimonadales bacterium]